MIGQTIGNYRVIGKLSEGGMGAVYRAEHALIGKPVAVKVLLPELSQRHEMVERFFNEAKATSAIRHPGIVEIFDFGYDPSGHAYIVMEFLSGETLAARLRALGRLPVSVAATVVRGLAGAVGAAHSKGIVHRDLKPDNVFLVPDPDMPNGERPKVLDFGIAKLADGGTMSSRTRTGTMMGTPTYMAPEQCRGAGAVDLRADIYAIGCILFETLIGRPPFVAEGFGELIAAHMVTPPPSPRSFDPSIPPELEAVVMTCLAKKPEERFPSMEALMAALDGTGLTRRTGHLAWGESGTSPGYPLPGSGVMTPPPGMPMATPPPGVPMATPQPGMVGTSPSGPASVTTLGGSAATTTTPPHASRGGRWLAIGAVFALAMGGGAFALSRGGKASTPGVAASGEVAGDRAPDPTPPREAPAAPPPSAPPIPAVEQVTIDLQLTPPSAIVTVDGKRADARPLVLPRSERSYVVEVSAPGFVAQRSSIKADVNSRLSISLATAAPAAQPAGPRVNAKPVSKPKKPTKPSAPRAGTIETDL